MKAALLALFQWRTLGARGGAPLTLVRTSKKPIAHWGALFGFLQRRTNGASRTKHPGGPPAGNQPNRSTEPRSPRTRRTLIPLATCDGFTLFERKGCSTAQWLSLKLVRSPPEPRTPNSWYLGWNGARMARNTDAVKLNEKHPEVMQWVIDVLRSSSAKAAS
jgi:hypothetical protein